MKLAGKVALITGGATGIGFGTAKVFLEEGAHVVIAQPDGAMAEEAARRLGNDGATAVELDIRDDLAVEECVNKIVDRFSRIDVLVNNASVTGAAASIPFLDVSPEFIDRVVDTNIKGTVHCSLAVARAMVMGKHGGAIVHVGSVGGYAAQENASIYCATKAAESMLAKTMAIELAPYRIRVNCVAPGDILTQQSTNTARAERESGSVGTFYRVTPLGRRGQPEEVGRAIAFLASDEASFITGTTLLVDGGFLSY